MSDSILIPLTKGQQAIIDQIDEEKIKTHKWYAQRDGEKYYAMSTTISMHRFLLDAPDGLYVVHLNGDLLDNRQANLRLVTREERALLRQQATHGSETGILGVSVQRDRKRGRVRWRYKFSCRCAGCYLRKNFPYNEDGLRAATRLSETHHTEAKHRLETKI